MTSRRQLGSIQASHFVSGLQHHLLIKLQAKTFQTYLTPGVENREKDQHQESDGHMAMSCLHEERGCRAELTVTRRLYRRVRATLQATFYSTPAHSCDHLP